MTGSAEPMILEVAQAGGHHHHHLHHHQKSKKQKKNKALAILVLLFLVLWLTWLVLVWMFQSQAVLQQLEMLLRNQIHDNKGVRGIFFLHQNSNSHNKIGNRHIAQKNNPSSNPMKNNNKNNNKVDSDQPLRQNQNQRSKRTRENRSPQEEIGSYSAKDYEIPWPSHKNHSGVYAYAFVICGCIPENPTYRVFVYNILVAAKILRQVGSTADILAFFQLSKNTTATVLPDQDVRPLQALGVQIRYMEKAVLENFYGAMMRKFDLLSLTQYRRIIYMDGDVMPVGNLDYLFELSVAGVLEKNVVFMGHEEPANGGFFLIEPGPNRSELVIDIIIKREESSRRNWVFDPYKGWGHVIEPPDCWITRDLRGTNWTFHGAATDQGLLYHYVKYVRKSVSIVQLSKDSINGTVENWVADEHGNLQRQGWYPKLLQKYFNPILWISRSCKKYSCDFHHFSGKNKPWLRQPTLNLLKRPTNLWWDILRKCNRQLHLGLDLKNWTPLGASSLGYYAPLSQIKDRIVYRMGRHQRPLGNLS